MTIEATVVGVRLYPFSKGSRRHITLEWKDDSNVTDLDIRHTADFVDQQELFQLGDLVRISLTLMPKF